MLENEVEVKRCAESRLAFRTPGDGGCFDFSDGLGWNTMRNTAFSRLLYL